MTAALGQLKKLAMSRVRVPIFESGKAATRRGARRSGSYVERAFEAANAARREKRKPSRGL